MNRTNSAGRSLQHKHSTQLLQTKFNKNNIIIAVRSRPLNQKELEYSNYKTLSFDNREEITFLDIESMSSASDGGIYIGDENNLVITEYRRKQFKFDFSFNETTTQDEVYRNTTKMLLNNIMDGFNSTVFAYGATGSGKTYTMVGTDDNPGLMVKAIQDLFSNVKDQQLNGKNFTIKFSYVEVYNETLKDLLVDKSEQNLEIRDVPDRGTVVIGASVTEVMDENYAFELLHDGNKRRREKPTIYNENSSRSHAILQIYVEVEGKSFDNVQELTFGKFIMVDLAGSERITATAQGDKESGSINKSLLALSKCIASLVSNKSKHIPYRESKLTRMLKDSLSGNSRIVMIATVSPSLLNKDETLFTLQYANKAKNIKVNLTKNVIEQKPQINKYEDVIKELNNEINELKKQLKEKSINALNINVNNNNNNSVLSVNVPTENDEMKDNKEYKKLQDMIINHFEKEKQIKITIIRKEKEIDAIKNEMVLKHKEKKDEKDMNEKIEKINKEINNYYTNEQKLLQDRKQLNTIIIENINTYGKSLYNIYNYYIAYLNFLTTEHRKELNNNELNRKEETIKMLLKQLELRDQKIFKASKEIEKHNGDLSFQHNRFRTSEEIIKDPCEVPVITAPRQKTNLQFMSMMNNINKSPSKNELIDKTEEINNNNNNSNRAQQLLAPGIADRKTYNFELIKRIGKNNTRVLGNKGLIKQYKPHQLYRSNFHKSLDPSPRKVYNNNNNRYANSNRNILHNYHNFSVSRQTNNYSSSKNIRQFSARSSRSASPIRTERNNTSMNTSLSVFENQIEKKVKYILRRNIVGRYRKSPYLNMFN